MSMERVANSSRECRLMGNAEVRGALKPYDIRTCVVVIALASAFLWALVVEIAVWSLL
jgi:hypothetical protein